MEDDDIHLTRGQLVRTDIHERARELRRNMTVAEQVLWQRLRAKRLNGLKFRRQHPIANYIVDFYCPAARLVIEIDGPIHDQKRDCDDERTRVPAAHGLTVLRITNDMVLQALPNTLALIATHCKAATSYSPSPMGEEAGGRGPD